MAKESDKEKILNDPSQGVVEVMLDRRFEEMNNKMGKFSTSQDDSKIKATSGAIADVVENVLPPLGYASDAYSVGKGIYDQIKSGHFSKERTVDGVIDLIPFHRTIEGGLGLLKVDVRKSLKKLF